MRFAAEVPEVAGSHGGITAPGKDVGGECAGVRSSNVGASAPSLQDG